MYRLFSQEHSAFAGKARAYLRFKQRCGALGPGYEDILATPDLIGGLLVPRSGSGAIPQLEAPDGTWVQDTSQIIDFCEAAHPEAPVVPDAVRAPRQCLVAYLIELLADEWMIVPAFWERWYFSEDDRPLGHRGYHEQLFGAAFAAGAPGDARRKAGADFINSVFESVRESLERLGVTKDTEPAWQASQHHILGLLEAHFARHDYVFGGAPSLADFGILGPLYAQLYRDAVSGFALRTHFPLVSEWVERTNGEGALNARMYGQKLYSLDEQGQLVGRPATSDDGAWLPDDQIPETLLPILGVLFDEMWPVLRSSAQVLTEYIESGAHPPGAELPGGTFRPLPGFEALQTGEGKLTHEFEIGGVRGRRMAVPYQIWMLQRLKGVLDACTATAGARAAIEELLARFERGAELFELDSLLAGCRIRKQGGQLFSEPAQT